MNHSLIRRIICALVLLAALGVPGLFAQLETQAAHDARLQWWRDARFGLFIHWGLYAVPAGEWDGKTIYGESIYGTLASPFKSLAWGRSTQKAIGGGVRLYLHVFDWPADGKLVVPGILNSPKKAYLLSDAKKAALTVSRREDSLVVSLPAAAPDANDSVVVLDVAGKIDVAKQPIPGAAPAR
jgi:hypothetical protein